MAKQKHRVVEEVFSECPNCEAEVKGERFDNEKTAHGTCNECDTDFDWKV